MRNGGRGGGVLGTDFVIKQSFRFFWCTPPNDTYIHSCVIKSIIIQNMITILITLSLRRREQLPLNHNIIKSVTLYLLSHEWDGSIIIYLLHPPPSFIGLINFSRKSQTENESLKRSFIVSNSPFQSNRIIGRDDDEVQQVNTINERLIKHGQYLSRVTPLSS